jgi:hypothetical protein
MSKKQEELVDYDEDEEALLSAGAGAAESKAKDVKK